MSTAVGKDDGKSGFVSVGTTELTSGIKTPKDAFGAFEAVFVTCCQLAGSLTFSGSRSTRKSGTGHAFFFIHILEVPRPPPQLSRCVAFAGFRVECFELFSGLLSLFNP